MNPTTFPTQTGTYVLILHLAKATRLTIGKRGTFNFSVGFYAYVGSAFGTGGLHGRLKHHLQPVTKPHWHIDYLRTTAKIREVWYVADETRYEHQWAVSLHQMSDAIIPVPRFGASDCNCASHLVYFADMPAFSEFCDRFDATAESQITPARQLV